ncbi:hypothetical protein [Halobaculum sp. MBLA0143]|uniref:hypothetical protein n=1 Tax=Halobaculum sp. MBLA0143 TaxID=3079933 RepID=UPI0035249305
MSQTLDWFVPGSVAETVRGAREAGVSEARLVRALADEEFDADVELVEQLVETIDVAPPTTTDAAAVDTDTRRESPVRRVTVGDVEYTTRREFARVLGGVLTRYDGTFQPADPDSDLAVDLFWRRQHRTVGLRVEPRVGDDTVGETPVRSTVEGDTDPLVGRPVSRVAVVTNRSFTDAAVDAADGTDVELVGPETLRRWFGDARLSRAVAGDLVEAAGLTSEQFADLLDGVERVPDVRQPEDPLSVGGTAATDPTVPTDPTATPTGDPDWWAAGLDPHDGAVTANPSESGVLYDRGDEIEPESDDAGAVDELLDGLGGEPS